VIESGNVSIAVSNASKSGRSPGRKQSLSSCPHFWNIGIICQFHDHFTNGRTSRTSDQLVARPLLKRRTTQTHNKRIHTQTSMPCVGYFELLCNYFVNAVSLISNIRIMCRDFTITLRKVLLGVLYYFPLCTAHRSGRSIMSIALVILSYY
jgi:hypothetical protein